ncbi:hypothetical protein L7G72_20565 [Xenorhabdus bovienii]|uniref:hypothetical protein n=1 Tax=Xenorhabdus bovienii TaxID=40576 RepID=UPI001EE06EA9|nr:hypothetical protein [Xenorhabdus bovienii]MCG3464146.1 hypothetical protein [Xenorhabdus bovienii]
MTQSTPTHTFTIDIKCDTDTLSQLESQLKNIAEQMDRITGRRYDAGMKLSADVSVKTGITADSFKVFDSEGRLRVAVAPLKETVFGPVQTAEIINDDRIRQIVREEIRQFVNRESRCGGLFSKW